MKSRRLTPPKNSPDKDLIMTPPDLAFNIVEHFSPLINESHFNFMEPCRGQGAFYNAMGHFAACRAHVDSAIEWCELSEGRDFLKLRKPIVPQYHWLISNFPFSKYADFLEKSMQVADNIITYGTICHILSLKKRLRLIKDAGFHIREVLLTETPKGWTTGGFQCGAILLNRKVGDCKFSYL